MPDVDVRFAQKPDVRELSHVLGRAFFDDPVMMWMVPDDAKRARALPLVFGAMTRHHFLGNGAVQVADRAGNSAGAGRAGNSAGAGRAGNSAGAGAIGAAALWDPPGQWKQTPREELRMMPSFLRAMGLQVGRGMGISELMKKHHPEEPHWYLGVIGSDPDVRGGGFGHALMTSRLDRCDKEGAPAYLESSKESNVPYYMRFGFEVTGELTIPDGGPTMWQMWRRPG